MKVPSVAGGVLLLQRLRPALDLAGGDAVIIWHYPQGDFSALLSDIIIIISPFCRESNSQACKSRLLDFIGSLRNPAIDFGN